jgi:translation elongation factor EF-4
VRGRCARAATSARPLTCFRRMHQFGKVDIRQKAFIAAFKVDM